MKTNTIPSINDISPLPGQLEALFDNRNGMHAEYKDTIEAAESALNNDNLDNADEFGQKLNDIERSLDALTDEIRKTETELSSLVLEKLTDGQILFKKLCADKNDDDYDMVDEVADMLTRAKRAKDQNDLTAALLQAHQVAETIRGLLRDRITSRILHHRNKLDSL